MRLLRLKPSVCTFALIKLPLLAFQLFPFCQQEEFHLCVCCVLLLNALLQIEEFHLFAFVQLRFCCVVGRLPLGPREHHGESRTIATFIGHRR